MDDNEVLKSLLESLLEVNQHLSVVFPVHPRTRQRISEFGIDVAHLHLMEPIPYIEFLALQRRAAVVITDSGGIQEETTYLGVPCLTMREKTEPIRSNSAVTVLPTVSCTTCHECLQHCAEDQSLSSGSEVGGRQE